MGNALEVLAGIILALSTVGSAWGVYQASRWNNVEADTRNESNVARIESSKQTTLATATIVYDATLMAQSAAAVAEGRSDLQQFYRETLYRPEFRTFVDKLVQASGAVPNLIGNQDYLNPLLEKPRQMEDEALRLSQESERAGREANSYTLTTVILAITLFFAGTATSVRFVPARVALLAIAAVTLALGVARLASLPVI